MTLEEADKIARIIETADGGCSYCVESLAGMLNEAFPEFEWVHDDARQDTQGFYDLHCMKAVPR